MDLLGLLGHTFLPSPSIHWHVLIKVEWLDGFVPALELGRLHGPARRNACGMLSDCDPYSQLFGTAGIGARNFSITLPGEKEQASLV